MQNPGDSHPTNKAAPKATRSMEKSKLNSKRSYSDSEEEGSEDDLGFGDSDYFKDKKFGKHFNDDTNYFCVSR